MCLARFDEMRVVEPLSSGGGAGIIFRGSLRTLARQLREPASQQAFKIFSARRALR
jgi:hypothetical protein